MIEMDGGMLKKNKFIFTEIYFAQKQCQRECCQKELHSNLDRCCTVQRDSNRKKVPLWLDLVSKSSKFTMEQYPVIE